MIAPWARKYIGIPYSNQGRDPVTGLDCWGLVRFVLNTEFGLLLPSFSSLYNDSENRDETAQIIEVEREIIVNRQVLEPEAGDLAAITFCGRLCHIGIYAGDGYVLHITRGKMSNLEKISSVMMRNHIEGYYRVL